MADPSTGRPAVLQAEAERDPLGQLGETADDTSRSCSSCAAALTVGMSSVMARIATAVAVVGQRTVMAHQPGHCPPCR